MLIRNIELFGFGNDYQQSATIFITAHGKLEILTDEQYESFHQSTSINANHEYAIMPNWFDTHIHGYGGVDFSEVTADNIATITASLGKTGLSYCMATLVSLPLDKLKRALSVINDYVKNQRMLPGVTQIVGVHLEGPFIAKNCKGAHQESALLSQVDMQTFLDIISAAPDITEWKMTIAPELPGAIEFIKQAQQLSGVSVKIFIGHSNAAEEIITTAIQAGAVGFTHLGNACCEKNGRALTTLSLDDVTSNLTRWVLKNAAQCPYGVELIVDGKHLLKPYAQLITNTVADKIVLVTDALGASGLPDDNYKLGELAIIKDGAAFYLADPLRLDQFLLENGMRKLAGSAASFKAIVQQYAEWLAVNSSDIFAYIYQAAVKNPRQSALSEVGINKLADYNNFVIMNKLGELIISVCHGKWLQHKNDPSFPCHN